MNKTTFSVKPELFVREGGRVLRINFDVEEEKVKGPQGNDEEYTQYKAYSVRVKMPLEYSDIVSSIVTAAYSDSEMQAIINNHLSDSGNTEFKLEYEMMQFWRDHAKEIAKKVVDEFQQTL